jgi:hypothetical protein
VDPAFTWTHGRLQLILYLNGDSWCVESRSVSLLRGPDAIVHASRHKHPRDAAWDVMSQVRKATNDGETGVQVALDAAKWMHTVDWSQGSHH